jgi:hypothetical protein
VLQLIVAGAHGIVTVSAQAFRQGRRLRTAGLSGLHFALLQNAGL